ncbi:MAG: ATP-binding cassette domain-containing protein [Thermotogota bacterium]|jgi:ABC-type multidrug transport system ATPase subunit|nr:ATP-binding cassette domain-containing protein [Thermotogota bacterium]
MDKNKIIEIKDLSVYINNRKVLKNINLEISKNEILLIYGPRNAGKSLLARSIVALNEELFKGIQTTGEILFLGKDVTSIEKRYLRSTIAYSEPTFVDNINFLTLSEVFNLALRIKPSDISQEQYMLLEKLNIAHIFSNHSSLKSYENFGNWTIGDKISFIIFLSLARNPQVFIFDSILDHLDDFMHKDIKDFLFDIKEDRSLIISTRNLSLFSDIAEKIVFLNEGEIVYKGSTEGFILNFPS